LELKIRRSWIAPPPSKMGRLIISLPRSKMGRLRSSLTGSKKVGSMGVKRKVGTNHLPEAINTIQIV
jgi:hypothetical protein